MQITTSKPKYVQLAEQLRERIHSGDLKVGDRLPSYAEMYREHGATTATMQRVCDLLEQENLIERRRSSGVYVREPQRDLIGNIGLLIHSVHLTSHKSLPYLNMQMLLSGIREGCHEHEQEILLIDDSNSIRFDKVDGVLTYSDKLEAYAMRIPEKMPQVMLVQSAEDITSVTFDNYKSGKIATSHLVQLGHQRIACLMEELQDEPVQRIAGYRAALEEAEIVDDPHWLRKTRKTKLSSSFSYLEWGYQNMQAWLDEDWSQIGCTAIVVQNDHAAIGVMQALQDRGVDVPNQVSVIGFDGTDVCDLVRPHLASVEIPYYQIGKEAVKVLCEQIQSGSQPSCIITLPVRMREGSSVAPPNQQVH